MSNTTMNSAELPEKKSTVGYRLLGILLIVLSVAALLTSFANGQFAFGLKQLWAASDVTTDNNLIATIANKSSLILLIGLGVSVLLGIVALISAKGSTIGLAVLTWTAAIYAISNYVYADSLDYVIVGVVAVALLFYFILAAVRVGALALLSMLQFVLCAAVLYLVGESVWAKLGDQIYFPILVLVLLANAIYAFVRTAIRGGIIVDIVRYALEIVIVGLAAYFGKDFTKFALLALLIAMVQILIAVWQLYLLNKAHTEECVEAELSAFNTESYVEAYPYEGGPIAGVELAEEVNPTVAAIEAARDPDGTARATVASLLGNGFDPFLITLNDKEKNEFIDLYVLKCKGIMPEIPGYVVGGDNRDFFNKVFIYLGQYRDKIPADLLARMYAYSMKI